MSLLGVSLRRLRQSPTFTVFSVITLALGIGVTTAAYSAIYALFARPMGISDSDRVVFLTRTNSISRDLPAGVSWADFRDLSSQQQSFTGLAALSWFEGALSGAGTSQLVRTEAVSGDYFTLLGVRATIGRAIQAADDRLDAPLVIVLADTTWRSQFNASPAIVGTTVKIANQTLEVIGVMPVGFRGARSALVSGVAAWVPLSSAVRLEPAFNLDPTRRGLGGLTVIGRLGPRASVESAFVEVSTIGARLDEAAPLPAIRPAPTSTPVQSSRRWRITPLDTVLSSFNSGEVMRLFLALPALVLLVACTNLANLVLSRGVSRRHEFAVRAALGASRWRLIREELVETSVIALAGGALGVVATDGLLRWAMSVLREPLAALAPQFMLEWHLEPAVFAAAGAAVVLALVVAGLIPALQLTRPHPGRTLTADSGGALLRWRGRSNLIALQVGVSVGLFLITVVAVRFIVRPPSRPIGAGIDLARLAVANVPFGRQQYDEVRARRVVDAVLDDLRRSPDIEIAAAATSLPVRLPFLRGASTGRLVAMPGQPCVSTLGARTDADKSGVSPGVFEALGTPLRSGRFFDERDRAGAEPVVILNETLARRVFGQSSVAGRTVMLCPDDRFSRASSGSIETATVVGVVGDGDRLPNGSAYPQVYAPLAQHYEPAVTFLARARVDDARGVVNLMRAAVRRADPDLAVHTAGRADVIGGGPLVFLGFVATTTGGMATLALVLAMAGLYGVLSHVVAKRRREMGLRVALGASHARIVRLVLKDGLRPVAEGLFIGLGAALVIRQLMQLGFTETLSPIDLATFLLALVPLMIAGFVAAYLPARQAARVDPNVALKDL